MVDFEGTPHFEEDPLNAESFIIATDDEAQSIVTSFRVANEAGALHTDSQLQHSAQRLLEIAEHTGSQYSFSAHQTYPRISHPYPHLRKSPYFTLSSILISLRCTLATEMRVTDSLMEAAPDDEALLSLDEESIARIIKPSGFADRKARWIINGLQRLVVDESSSIRVLTSDPLSTSREKVLSLPGFGQKAADCFLLAGLNRASFPVDVNVFNLVTKQFPGVIPVAGTPSFSNPRHTLAVKNFLETTIPNDVKLYQIMHTYLLLASKYKVE